jgi:hypothetical protein
VVFPPTTAQRGKTLSAQAVEPQRVRPPMMARSPTLRAFSGDTGPASPTAGPVNQLP